MSGQRLNSRRRSGWLVAASETRRESGDFRVAVQLLVNYR